MKKPKASAGGRRKKPPAKKVPPKKKPALVTPGEPLGLRERLKAKHRRAGATGRPASELDTRDEIDRDSGRMTRREQFYDRQNDYTKETVTFQDTGEVKFTKDGKLSEKNKGKRLTSTGDKPAQ